MTLLGNSLSCCFGDSFGDLLVAVKVAFCHAAICCVSCEIALKTENGLSMSTKSKINRMS